MRTDDTVASLRPRPFGPPLRGRAALCGGIMGGRPPVAAINTKQGAAGSTLKSPIRGRRLGVGADIDEKKLEPTDYNAIDFSPNGKYYFVDTAMMEVPMQLYLRSNNKDIIGTERNSIPPKIAWGLYAEKWLNDDLILVHPSFLPRAKSESGYFTNDIILDIKNKQLYVTQDKVIDIRNNGKDVVMVKLSPEHLELIYRLDRCTIVIKALKSLEAVSFQSMEKQIVPPEDLYMQYLNEKTSLPPEGPKTAPPPSPRRHGL